MMRRTLPFFLISLSLLVVLLTLVLTTQIGLDVSASLAKKILPGKLHYKTLKGRLIGPIDIQQLHYQDHDTNIHLASLHLDWAPVDLFHGQFHITALQAKHVHLTLGKTQHTPSKQSKSHWPIRIENAHISDLRVGTEPNIYPTVLKTVSLHAKIVPDTIIVQANAELMKPIPLHITLRAKGNFQHYTFHMHLRNSHFSWVIDGTGNAKHIQLKTAEAKTLGGTLSGHAEIQWAPLLKWNATLNAKQLNLNILYPSWPRTLSIALHTQGHQQRKKLNYLLHAVITAPQTHIKIDATQKTYIHLKWDIAIGNLSGLLPQAEGSLYTQGQWINHPQHPIIKGTLKGKNLAYLDYQIGTLNSQWRVYSNGQHPSYVTLEAQHLQQGNIDIATMTLNAKGTPTLHTLSTNLTLNGTRLSLQAHGGFSQQHWSGTLQKLRIESSEFKTWQLSAPAQLSIGPKRFSTSPLCLTGVHNPGKLCFKAQWNHKNPTVKGSLELLHGSIHVKPLGIQLSNMNLKLTSSGKALHYKAHFTSDQRPINIEGSTAITEKGLKTHLAIKTDNTLIMNTPEYHIYATTDLTLHILNREVEMTGEVTIPKGVIQPQEFTNTVSLPEDQIIYVGKQPQKRPDIWKITSNIKVTLGDEVTVDTSGFKATIAGTTTIMGSPKHTTLAKGRISIKQGTFSAYGKTLTLQPGSYIQFVNSPISNPSMSVRATKVININQGITGQDLNVNDLTVGVYLTGTFRHPNIKLYSMPATLSQADILSYLVLGYASSSNSSGNLDLLLQAANSISLGGKGAGVGGAVSEIKQGLGLSELGVESETLVDALGTPIDQQTAFVVGKHLTKRIYIRYSLGLGQGPFTPVNIFQARYTISKNWAVQSDSSSLGNGVDLLYSIEQD